MEPTHRVLPRKVGTGIGGRVRYIDEVDALGARRSAVAADLEAADRAGTIMVDDEVVCDHGQNSRSVSAAAYELRAAFLRWPALTSSISEPDFLCGPVPTAPDRCSFIMMIMMEKAIKPENDMTTASGQNCTVQVLFGFDGTLDAAHPGDVRRSPPL